MKYNKKEICIRANKLTGEGMNKSTAFKTAWAEAKTPVTSNDIVSAPNLFGMAKAFKEIQAQIETLQAQLDELKESIVSEMNGEQEITTADYTIKYITITRNILDTQKFKKDYEDLYSAYLKENESKRFSISA